jgi:phage tail-like protein
MARPQADDLLQSFRFRVMETKDTNFLESVAGFNNVTTPEVSDEVAEYREGNKVYTLKFPGIPSVENITMTKGIAQKDGAFWDWALAAINKMKYRADLIINVYSQELPGVDPADSPSRQIVCKNCFPTRVKPVGDLDATSSDVNMQELEAVMEEMSLKIIGSDGTAPALSNV